MTDPDLDALYDLYPAIIAQMPEEFTSHEFIQKLAQQNQVKYIEALYARCLPNDGETTTPFQTVHALLAKKLNGSPLIEKFNYEVESKNIFGHYTKCAKWRKIS